MMGGRVEAHLIWTEYARPRPAIAEEPRTTDDGP
jgi:hypothetical protein